MSRRVQGGATMAGVVVGLITTPYFVLLFAGGTPASPN